MTTMRDFIASLPEERQARIRERQEEILRGEILEMIMEREQTLREHVEGQVHFQYYRDGSLWYQSDSGFTFPVPIEDIGTATFLRDDKALLFMRYIRKFMKTIADEKKAAISES